MRESNAGPVVYLELLGEATFTYTVAAVTLALTTSRSCWLLEACSLYMHLMCVSLLQKAHHLHMALIGSNIQRSIPIVRSLVHCYTIVG